MTASGPEAVRAPAFASFERQVPSWFTDAKLGVFVHWGPYSVPAWAEPIGPLGTFEPHWWMAHNPYAEWYYNTIRIEGSGARQHHLDTFGGADYDDFLDLWHAERFDADALMDLVSRTGARYFIPTTKHHDGVTLWDAPGTGDRNTVRRGPGRDLVAEFRAAAEARGIRFGVYYSGGLDWHANRLPPITGDLTADVRPVGREYADYAHDHVVDLIDRYRPSVLWGDIDWPDAGKAPGGKSLVDVFEHFYAMTPDGVVNDRWGQTHWDYRTSEYAEGRAAEQADSWEHCRGIGFSFGYNAMEDESHHLSGAEVITMLVDVVSRGGNLLLNVGLTAAGEVPELQARVLRELARFNEQHGEAVFGSRPLDPAAGRPSELPWVRWTRTGETAHAFVGTCPDTELDLDADRFDLGSVAVVGLEARVENDRVSVRNPHDAPGRISVRLREP